MHSLLLLVLLLCSFFVHGKNLVEHLRNNNRSVLCIGDSLTHGLIPIGSRSKIIHMPYAHRLSHLLNNNSLHTSAASKYVHVIEEGVDGERTEEMAERLGTLLPHHPRVGLVIILGGTNDINQATNASTIIKNIAKMHTLAHAHSPDTYTIAITIPDLSPWIHLDVTTAKYLEVNVGIRAFQKSTQKKTAALFEMEKRWVPHADYAKFWSQDRVHFSEVGSRSIAEHLFVHMRDNSLED